MLNKIFTLALTVIFASKLFLWLPTIYFINLVEAIALLVMVIVVGTKIWRKQIINFSFSKLLTTLLLLSIATISWMTSYADFRTTKEAAEFNQTIDQLIKSAVIEQKETGKITNLERFKTQDAATSDKLEQAAEIILSQSNKSAAQIISEVNPKINLIENQWNCSNWACGYATPDYVWTVNLVQYYFGLVLSLASLKIVAFDWNLLWPNLSQIRKLFKRPKNHR